MARRELSKSQIICIVLLWVVLVYILLSSSSVIDGKVIFAIIASGIIVFVPIYKGLRKK